jgi:hypothetical protein
MRTTAQKVLLAVGCGLMVTASAALVHATTLPLDRTKSPELIGDLVAGLVAMVICLAIHLKYESLYFRFAMERAAIVAEVNHHVRNAVFPLCMIAQRTADPETNRIAADAVDKINIALRDAITDALSRNVNYSESGLQRATSKRAA